MKINFTKSFITFLLFLSAFYSIAQKKTITGTVQDESGPLPGASVAIKGTEKGTITDFDGKYSIEVEQGDVLVFSYVGMTNVEKTVGSNNTISVTMESGNELEEVVVVAYGSQSKESLTGSVKTIGAEEITKTTFSNATKSLEGRVSGLRIIQSNGQPGADATIRIRGFGSVNASTEPLIVLDGVPYSGSLSSINPQDIATTTVLKDASSTSLYGNKAANGVLLITTKKGSQAKTQINISSRYGFTSRATKDYDVIKTPKEFYEVYHSIVANSEFARLQANANLPNITIAQARQFASNNLIPGNSRGRLGYNLYNVADTLLVDPTTGKLNPNARLLVNDRWEDALFTNSAGFSSLNVNMSGGNEGMTYYFSLGTEDNNGYTKNSGFNRKTARFRVNSDKIVSFLTLGGDFAYTNSSSQFVPSDGSGTFNNTFSWVRRIAPIYPVFRHDEDWNKIPNANNPSGFEYDFGAQTSFGRGPRNYAPNEHPLATIENTIETTDGELLNFNINAEMDLPFGIKFQNVISYLSETQSTVDLSKPEVNPSIAQVNGRLTNSEDKLTTFTTQQLLKWKKDIDENSFDLLLGHEFFKENTSTLSATKENFIGGLSPILDNASRYIRSSNFNTQYTTQGIFSRFIYGRDSKYFLNLTARRDASSVFSPENRWGTFWSAGVSWVLSKESFMENLDFVNYAKFAANYGTTGNDRIFYPNTATRNTGARGSSGTRNLVTYKDQYQITESNGELALQLLYLGNPDLTWEKSGSLDIAFESTIFDRVNFTLGYYRKNSTDLLFNTPLPLSTSSPSKPENAGTLVNSGFEGDVSVDIVKGENVKWNVNANVTTIHNEITKLPRDSIQTGSFRRVVGRSLFDYYTRKFAGVNSSNGNAQWFRRGASGQDEITEDYSQADRYFLDKKAIPIANGGFGTAFSLGKFSFDFQFSYQIGGYGLDIEYYSLFNQSRNVTNFADYDKTWTFDNRDAKLPRVDMSAQNQYAFSDLYLIDMSFLSLNNVNISYRLENKNLKKYHIDNIEIFGTVNNAALLYSARQGYDPRLSTVGSSSGEFGANRTVSFGVNIKIN